MNKGEILLMTIISAVVWLCPGCGGSSEEKSVSGDKTDIRRDSVAVVDAATSNEDSVPAGAAALIAAYPENISGYRGNRIIFKDGESLVYDDGREKDFEQMLDDSDAEDMFSMTYRRVSPPAYLDDAGRSRCDSLFKKMYGDSERSVSRNLVNVDWFGQKVRFSKVNGAAGQLKAVAEEIAKHPELRKYIKCAGTFYWRKVRGAQRRSAHSYGIAIDIGLDYSDYWLWKNKGAGETSKIAYCNRMPAKLVDIFERHGFIWGGAWYHYDTMHFEYRPEILHYAHKAASSDHVL